MVLEEYYPMLIGFGIAIFEVMVLLITEKIIEKKLLICKKHIIIAGVVIASILGIITVVEMFADEIYFNNKGIFDIVDNVLFCILLSFGWFTFFVLWRNRQASSKSRDSDSQ